MILRRAAFLCFALLFSAASFAANFSSSKSIDPLNVNHLKKRIRLLTGEILEMRESVEELEKEHRNLLVELSDFEKSFQARFSRVMIPLLSWPSLPPMVQRQSWVEQEHLKLVLLSAREHLVKEPLELISERELMMSRVQDKKKQVSEALKYLESKQEVLNLQLEELQFLQKKWRKGLTRNKKG